MKKLLLSTFLVLYCVLSYAQELPKIIPPSPNAAAFHVYGNTQVNYYTGSPNISIPIHTVKEGDLSLPIYLKYTGGNGIKVEEVASWVGLGWTLNTGGAISRVRRGKVDEDPNYGYLNINSLPSLDIQPDGQYVDYANLEQTLKGNRDTEPDLFMYNFPGGSGQFFIRHNDTVFFRPQKDLNLTFSNAPSNETVSQTACLPTNGKLGKFTLKDELGYIYEFDERERSNSLTVGVPYTDNRAFPSSWLLTKMQSPKTNKSIDFNYQGFAYEDLRLSANMTASGVSQSENETYTRTYYIGKRIQTITYSQGTISFVTSSNTRKDIEGQDKSLKEILVKDKSGKLIKRFVFSYKYITPTGLLNESSVSSYSNANRLILSSITEYNSNGIAKPPYQFTYNTQYKLPSRDSKSKDHWGFYNGKSNIRYLPKHYVNRYDRQGNGGWKNEVYGSADRSVSTAHEQAGILTEVKYPTGGKTIYSYESHTAKSDNLAGVVSNSNIALGFPNSKHTINVDLNSNALPISKVTIGNHYIDFSSNRCYPVYHIKNLSTNITSSHPYNPYDSNGNLISPPSNIHFPDIYLEDGQYEVWYTLQSNFSNNCATQDPAPTMFSWENESPSPNKLVGGVRIKTIKDITETGEIERNFNYEISPGTTSGTVVFTPKYTFLKLQRYLISGSSAPGELGTYQSQPNGLVHHSIPSLYPLVNTQGSPVGYGKVTVSYKNYANGKTEYYYTTANDFPDTFEGKSMRYNLKSENGSYVYYSNGYEYGNRIYFLGKYIDIYPVVTPDSKDFLRGLLKKEISYQKNGSTYSAIQEKENFYDNLYFTRGFISPGSIDNYIDQPKNFIEGISSIRIGSLTFNPFNGGTQTGSNVVYRYYDIYTGYTVPFKTTQKQYFSDGSSVSTTTHKYLKDSYYNLFLESFIPRETEVLNSKGELLKTKTYYATDLNNSTLISQHRIGEPLKVESFKGSTKLSEQNTVYFTSNGLYVPQKIQTAKGSGSLEDRIIYHVYDDKGNPIEVSKKDGTKIYYVWGYDKTLPIAKIEGYTSISSVQQTAINNAISASNTDLLSNTSSTENDLRTKLTDLRNSFSSTVAQVTTFTYDVLIGVTTITDPRGDTVYYHYDNFNRLQYVKDKYGNVLKENQYNYKN